MKKQCNIKILAPAQRELDEIAIIHKELIGSVSARKITNRIYDALEKLEIFPEMGVLCKDKNLAAAGYRILICENYLCFYRLINDCIYVYHIVDGRSNYPKLLSDLR